MTAKLLDLIAFLSQDVSLPTIAERVGPITAAPAAPLPAELAPTAKELATAKVWSDADTGKPSAVELVLREPIPVAELVRALGPYRQGRSDRGRPRELQFAARGQPWEVVVLAYVPAESPSLEAAEVSRLALRRDEP